MNNDITLVTNFFDIGRGKLPNAVRGLVLPHFQHRSTDVYFDYFRELAPLENEMVVYTSKEFSDIIYNIRRDFGLESKTTIVEMASYCFPGFEDVLGKIKTIQNSPSYYSKVDKPHFVEYWWPEYILIQYMKVFYVNDAIEKSLIKTDLTAWIDFGYCRNKTTLPESKKWTYDFARDKMHLFSLKPIEPQRPIDDIIYRGDVYVMGCHIVGGTDKWKSFKNYVIEAMEELLKHDLIHYDQTLYLIALLMHPEEFELRYIHPSDWFVVLKYLNDTP